MNDGNKKLGNSVNCFGLRDGTSISEFGLSNVM